MCTYDRANRTVAPFVRAIVKATYLLITTYSVFFSFNFRVRPSNSREIPRGLERVSEKETETERANETDSEKKENKNENVSIAYNIC